LSDLYERSVQLLECLREFRLQRGVVGTAKPKRLCGGHVSVTQCIDCGRLLFAGACAVRDVEQPISDAEHRRRDNDFARRSVAGDYARDRANCRSVGEGGTPEFVNSDYLSRRCHGR